MKKYISSLFVMITGIVLSQTILNAKSPEEFRKLQEDNMRMVGDSAVSNKIEPLSYGYIGEKDVLRAIYVWEIIDLNDKINQPFYHSDEGSLSGQGKSLYSILLKAALSGDISEVYDDDQFLTKLDTEGVERKLRRSQLAKEALDILEYRELTPEEVEQYTDVYETTSERVEMLKLFGMWFIDARDGQMKYRPLGIAAMGPDPSSLGRMNPETGLPLYSDDELVDIFWIYYPDARKILTNNIVFNKKNSASDLNFDDLLNARRFSSIIYKSSIGSGNGDIRDYLPRNADEQIEESDRIKGKILEMENQMWNY